MSTNVKCLEQGSLKPRFNEGKPVLYGNRTCPYVQRVRLVLVSKEIPHETVNVNLFKKPDWFKALTPKAQVPILELNDGKILHESIVISNYLNGVYPGRELYSDDLDRKAADEILILSISEHSDVFQYVFSEAENAVALLQDKINQILTYYEAKLCECGTVFFGGNKPMMVDYMLWPFLERLDAYLPLLTDREILLKRPPKIAKWTVAMLDDHAVKETQLSTAIHVKYLKSIIDGNPNPDIGLSECE